MTQAALTARALAAPRARPRTRPALRVTAPRRNAHVATFVVLATIFTLVSAVVFHVVLAQGQLQLDGLDRKIDTARREYEEQRLEVSTLASPPRIIQQAEALGLVMPDSPPAYLVVPGAPAPRAQGGGTATTLDDWKKVKRHLGDGP
jgi:hypothetical protein